MSEADDDAAPGAVVGRSVGAALARAGMAHRARAQELLAAVGLHPGQEFLLCELWGRDPRTPGQLADALGVEPPTVSKMVRRLEASGLVQREPDPTDGRRTRVHLTDRGRELAGPFTDLWAQLEAEATSDLTVDEQATLRGLLVRVREALRPPDPTG